MAARQQAVHKVCTPPMSVAIIFCPPLAPPLTAHHYPPLFYHAHRGGDFFKRQANGEHPKQLNYSRAFGGKDLKMFGLSVEPDISHFEITPDDKLVLLASDGLWDVINPRAACEIGLRGR